MNQDRAKRKLTAIFSADVVEYSRLMEDDEAWTIQSLEENKRLMSSLIEEYKGRVVDAPGDNLLAEFSSVTNAVECAVKIQQELGKKNANLIEERRMAFRIGVNLGEVVEEGGRIYGSGVNIASRLEGLTEPGGICISRRAYDHVKTKLDLGYEYLGEHNVKNISEPIRVYRVLMDSKTAGKVIGEKRFVGRISRRMAITAIIMLIAIAVGLLFWNIYFRQTIKTKPASIEPEQPSVASDVKEVPKTIAVLPFLNRSSEKDQEYFVDGLTDEINNKLTKIPDLQVTSNISSFTFKGSDKTIQEIADILGVAHILTGTVRKVGNALRITAQLIRTVDDRQLWSETYDREFKDIFPIQDDIATAVADELKVELGIGKSLKQLGGTDNLEAYEYFLIAKGQLSDFFRIGAKNGSRSAQTSRAQESLDAAIALDPEFALAWAFKTLIHWYHLTFTASYRIDSDLDPGLNTALRAIELEPDLAEAYYALGLSRYLRSEFIEAELAYRKAMELSPDPRKCYLFGFPLYSITVGDVERTNKIIEAFRQIDPLNRTNYANSILTTFFLGGMQRAEEKYEHGKAIFGDQFTVGQYQITLLRLGAKDVVSHDEIVSPDLINITLKEYLDSPEAGIVELHRIFSNDDELTHADFREISIWAAYFGDPEFAMEAMEKAVSISGISPYFFWFPVFREVRQLPRFKENVRKCGLVDFWNEFGWPDNNICRPAGESDFECD